MKHHEQHARLAFDEQRALEDLQRLHREIQRARRQREQAESEFERFVREPRDVRKPAPVPPPRTIAPPPQPEPAPAAAGPAPERPPVATSAPPAAAAESAASRRAAVPAVMSMPEPASPAATEPVTEPKRHTPSRRWLLVVAPLAALAVLAAVFLPRLRQPAATRPAPPPPAARQTTPAPAPAVGPVARSAEPSAPAQPTAPAPAEPAPPLLVEITTLRPVWLRATVDGRRLFERELPAGRQIPLRAEKAVLLRVGDAGALSLRVDGRPIGPLGRDGAVATRLFEAAK